MNAIPTPEGSFAPPPSWFRRNRNWMIPLGIIFVIGLCLVCLALTGLMGYLLYVPAPTATPVVQPPPVPTDVPQPRPTDVPVPVPTPFQPVPTPTAAPLTSSYPLSGQSYSSPQGHEYDALWTSDGRLWQPKLPQGNSRIAHTVGITIEEGTYAFDGVECQLFVDPTRNGAGASNPVTAEYGNDLRFVVDTADGGQAWGLVECRGNFSSGFQIRFLGQ